CLLASRSRSAVGRRASVSAATIFADCGVSEACVVAHAATTRAIATMSFFIGMLPTRASTAGVPFSSNEDLPGKDRKADDGPRTLTLGSRRAKSHWLTRSQ